MPRAPRVTVAEVLRALPRDGWEERGGKSHAILRHPTKPGYVTVPRHRTQTLKIKTLQAILDQAGLTTEEFLDLL
ncbi:MAG TPA: type II toxin-antitoxin system HicA family toxin [Thermomicrobiaceae bacterium]|nr:type II toxin-antitoxin system HicA family toxin [Thermomicrobiaceae bacterium]